uniref:Protein kinase n=1 Tax=Jahnella sp. MSr9139 TaxID=1434086 RepID=A0A3Q8I2D6_9BACT|nr:protein kinase [Jahnella sp. MSr9139]
MEGPPVQPGDVLAGKYQVDRVLGAGGMGVVVAAHQLGLDRTVALKLMLPGQWARPEAQARFLREARATVRLKSQHVARVFDVGTIDSGSPYIVFEFLEGVDLAELLRERGPLPVADAVEHVLQACEAVAEAHAAGIVHRDLKPANLFLTTQADGSPCVKVLDFGISKVSVADLQLTGEQQAMGSPLYMSPEQMRSSRDVDPRSDVWSIGVVLYELLAGRTPFHTETLEQLCARVLLDAPTPLGAHRLGLPPGLTAAILRCLEKDPAARWPTIAAFAAALAPFAPPRALPYVDRVAAVLRADVRGSHSGSHPAIAPPLSPSTAPLSAFAGSPAVRDGVATAPLPPSPPAMAHSAAPSAPTPEPSPPLPRSAARAPDRPRWIEVAAPAAAALIVTLLGASLWIFVLAPARASAPASASASASATASASASATASASASASATASASAPASAAAPASASAPAPASVTPVAARRPTAKPQPQRAPSPPPTTTGNPYQRK